MVETLQAIEGPDGGAVRCAIVGDEPLAEQCADIATAHGLDVVVIATTNPMVRDYGREKGITTVGPGAELGAALDEHPADVLLSIANLRLISDDVLAKVRLAINYHDGPLPGYAGLNVTTWALLAGEHEHGITWHLMTSDVDGGHVVTTEHFPVADDETGFSLNARCYEAALLSFPRIAGALAAGAVPTTAQPDGTHRMFMRHDRPAVLLEPSGSAGGTARAVRALDLGARIRNSLGVVRLVVGDEVLVLAGAVADGASGAVPGTVLEATADRLRMAMADGDLLVTTLTNAAGVTVAPDHVLRRHALGVGDVLADPPAALLDAVRRIEPQLSKSERQWLDDLAGREPTPVSGPATAGGAERPIDAPSGADAASVVAAVAAWLHRTTATERVAFSVTEPGTRDVLDAIAPLGIPPLIGLDMLDDASFADLRDAAAGQLELVRRRGPLLADAVARDPVTRGHDLVAPVAVDLDGASTVPHVLRFVAADGGLCVVGEVDATDPGRLDRIAAQVGLLLRAGVEDPGRLVRELPMLAPAELALLDAVNVTAVDHDRSATITTLFHAQSARTPDAPAVSFGDVTLSYRDLEAATTAFARRLAGAGAGRGDIVGIAVPRGLDMLVGVLAALEIGAAYLPLDPTYPIDRLTFMVEDAGVAVLVANPGTLPELRRSGTPVVEPGNAPDTAADAAAADEAARPEDLAYLIYTSGSTGKPKGVMLEHRQVTNFFVAMDAVIDVEPAGTWLAVTSLSFDISVLELLWTLTRGFHIVLKSDRGVPAHSSAPAPARPVTFSMFYFAAGEDTASDGYRLLLESARFADRHGFEAVWTPERHFHAFGGAYPNPSVIGAALATATTNVQIRAGSVVLPLHSPIRVAEEWAVVDNLSRGRVAISFAAGWQPNDFVLNPTAFAGAKEQLPHSIELVQRLWRGETVAMPGHDGAPVDVRTLPRPVQAELPVWLTSAGTPATFERAGTLGVNVLTHLLGQSVEQLAENIARYRAAWAAAGHDGEGRVTLMMHTYLDEDADTAREVAREPMKAYLGTAVGLLRDVASAFPTFANRGKGTDDLFKSLTPDELDQLLEVAAHRYLGSSGLFGTADDAVRIVEEVSTAGVDEVACLIDFGVDTDAVLESLDLLLAAKATVDERRRDLPAAGAAPTTPAAPVIDPQLDTVAALVARHGVTHLQCTPSLAAMLVADPADREALRSVRHLMLGGEALPTALGAELRELLPARFTNMYGPTETTIWSLTAELPTAPEGPVPIGTPIANTTIFVLDPSGQRVPLGAFGELHIGGEGVARGYHNRPELTAERFVDRPGMGRVYATGDVVRLHPDGFVEFAGRSDNQVKIRGHRIELGEIEAVLDRHPEVVQSVVVARADKGDTRLVAFVVLHHGATVTSDDLRRHVGDVLPDAMVPSSVTPLDAFPLTPNGKIDRKALPADVGPIAAPLSATSAPPADDTERLVSEVWSAELERPVGRDDNFFDIGGHSLLAVKVFRRLSDETAVPLALTDVFRFPTVRAFAAHVTALRDGNGAADAASATPDAVTGTDRGAMRRRALTRRGGPES